MSISQFSCQNAVVDAFVREFIFSFAGSGCVALLGNRDKTTIRTGRANCQAHPDSLRRSASQSLAKVVVNWELHLTDCRKRPVDALLIACYLFLPKSVNSMLPAIAAYPAGLGCR